MATKQEGAQVKPLTCGLIMPISQIEDCGPEHWLEVKGILTEAISSIEDIKFDTRLVSDRDDVGVIHQRIIGAIFNSDVVICDLSCKNPNVMFELGLRLASDKPTVLIKDDRTEYVFDTGIIEHIAYPRDLRFSKINTFKSVLASKVVSTYKASLNQGYSQFLSNFGNYDPAKLPTKEGGDIAQLMEMMNELSRQVSASNRQNNNSSVEFDPRFFKNRLTMSASAANDLENILESLVGIHAAIYASEHPNDDISLTNRSFINYVYEAVKNNPSMKNNRAHLSPNLIKRILENHLTIS